jgi:aminopeptidase-like protein
MQPSDRGDLAARHTPTIEISEGILLNCRGNSHARNQIETRVGKTSRNRALQNVKTRTPVQKCPDKGFYVFPVAEQE